MDVVTPGRKSMSFILECSEMIVIGVSVAMELDFALRVFQQQIDNFYGYQLKPGQ